MYFPDIMVAKRQPHSIDTKVISRIYGKGRGYVFTPADFVDLASQGTVHQALSRHARAGTIRKLARGLYDYPRQNPKLGPVPPYDEDIAKALNGRHSTRIQASGAHAANRLGLSTQVPMRTVFLTDGPTRKVQIGRRQIVLKNTALRQMATAGRVSGTVIQAMRWIGQRQFDEPMVETLRRRLSDADRQLLLKDLRYAPAWIAKVMREVAQPPAPTSATKSRKR